MKYVLIGLKIFALVAVTTALEFTFPSLALYISPALAGLLILNLLVRREAEWLLIAALILIPFPELQSQLLGPIELHHALLMGASIGAILSWLKEGLTRPPLLLLLVILFLLVATMLTLFEPVENESYHRLFVLFFMSLITLSVPYLLTKIKHLQELYWSLFGAALLATGIGLFALYFAVITNSYFGNPYLHISLVEGVPRIAGTLLDSNFLAHFLLLVIPAGIAILLTGLIKTKALYRFFTVGLLVTGSAYLLTYSRSGYIGLAVAAVALLLTLGTKYARGKIFIRLVGIFLAMVVLATALYPAFAPFTVYRTPTSIIPAETKESLMLGFNPTRLVNEYREKIKGDPTLSDDERDNLLARDVSSDSLGYRIDFWEAGIDMFKDHPFTGVGIGQFRYQYKNYSSSNFLREPDTHNIYIELLAEVGIFGFALFVLIIITAFKNLLQVLRSSKGIMFVSVAGILSSLVGVLVQSALLGGLGSFAIYLLVGLSATVLLIKQRVSTKS